MRHFLTKNDHLPGQAARDKHKRMRKAPFPCRDWGTSAASQASAAAGDGGAAPGAAPGAAGGGGGGGGGGAGDEAAVEYAEVDAEELRRRRMARFS
eukprot:COSAG06_NODE_28779_length_568_cov_1.213220_1_plen_96_part_00